MKVSGLIEKNAELLSKKQKNIAEFILKNKEKVVFMTSTRLAELTATSDATINRFVKILGFTGYMDFQSRLQVEVQGEITTLDRFPLNIDLSSIHQIGKTFASEVKIINRIINDLDPLKVNKFLNMVDNATNVYVFGERASVSLRCYTAYALGKILPRVTEVTLWDEKIYTSIIQEEKPLCIMFSFPRYPSLINRIANDLAREGIEIAAFTDSPITDVGKLSSITFSIPFDMVTFIDPYAGCICLIHGLIDMIASNNPQRTKDSLAVFEKYAKEYGIFS